MTIIVLDDTFSEVDDYFASLEECIGVENDFYYKKGGRCYKAVSRSSYPNSWVNFPVKVIFDIRRISKREYEEFYEEVN